MNLVVDPPFKLNEEITSLKYIDIDDYYKKNVIDLPLKNKFYLFIISLFGNEKRFNSYMETWLSSSFTNIKIDYDLIYSENEKKNKTINIRIVNSGHYINEYLKMVFSLKGSFHIENEIVCPLKSYDDKRYFRFYIKYFNPFESLIVQDLINNREKIFKNSFYHFSNIRLTNQIEDDFNVPINVMSLLIEKFFFFYVKYSIKLSNKDDKLLLESIRFFRDQLFQFCWNINNNEEYNYHDNKIIFSIKEKININKIIDQFIGEINKSFF
jgi:hypothetical protein